MSGSVGPPSRSTPPTCLCFRGSVPLLEADALCGHRRKDRQPLGWGQVPRAHTGALSLEPPHSSGPTTWHGRRLTSTARCSLCYLSALFISRTQVRGGLDGYLKS